MSVGRNEPCPCDSGKKYKKCCLQKENIIELASLKRNKFYEDKQQLVEKVGKYLQKQIPQRQYNQLKKELLERTNDSIEDELEESFFTYWLYFYHRFDNNVRGIEWFYDANKAILSDEERTMTETWINMEPRLLQAVDVQDQVVIFKDMLTNETFPLSNDAENIEHLVPWASTIAMIEQFEGAYYFNGFRFTVEPLQMDYALDQIDRLANENAQTKTAVISDTYPDLVSLLLNKDRMKMEYGQEVHEYTLTYHIQDKDAVLDFLRNQDDFRIDKWLDNVKEIVWAGNWRVYHDNENSGPLQLADIFGNMVVYEQDTKFTFRTMHFEVIADLKSRLEPLENALVIEDESSEPIGYFLTKVHNVLVSMEDDMPAYFAIYAQNNIYDEIDRPIAIHDNLTLRDFLKQGKLDVVEKWLQTTEFNLYKQILERFHSVEVSADFNTFRKEFNLPLSPFVTGGANRRTELLPIELEETATRLLEEDIPYLEALDFTPDSLDTFHIHDFIRFYKEKTIGKSDATIRKYRNSLSDLRILMESTAAESWEACDQAYWEQLVSTQYEELKPNYSKTERANFLSVLKTFLTWIDQIHETNYFKATSQYLQTVK